MKPKTDFEFGRSIGATHYVESDNLKNEHQFMQTVIPLYATTVKL